MDKENKKVNSVQQGENRSNALDEIMDGFYDLSSLYSDAPKNEAPKTREEELRLKDEKRRELEMQAIKEDIERRYSLQLEDARSKIEPEVKKIKRKTPSAKPEPVPEATPEIEVHEAVREELERINEIINSENAAKEKTSPKKKMKPAKKAKVKKPKEQKTVDLSQTNPFYSVFYLFGDAICRFLKITFVFIFKIIKAPFARIFRALSSATESTKLNARRRFSSTVNEIVHFRSEIRHGTKVIKRALKNPKALPAIISHYFKKAFSRHGALLKTAFNTLLPTVSLMILIATVNFWNGVTFALEVIYNDQSIGYISDESVYIEAKNLVKDRLSSGAYTSENIEATVAAAPASNLNARYSLSLVSLDELNDAQAISDKMIENSVDNLTHACGIYIDGEFVCAVKNEADAKTVFDNILAPYEADAQSGGYVVSLAETIDYVQGLYREDGAVMWDAARLADALNGSAKTHSAAAGDTLESISLLYGVDEDTLKELNPDCDWENLTEGTSIKIKSSEKLVSIKKIVTTSEIREIEFETVKRRDATKYSGYRRVSQKGINGSERVTKTQIYIDGVLEDTQYDYETLEEPVDEIVTVGTKTTYNGVYIGSASKKGFLWPAPSCHYVSSPYGWRSRGWHSGIDLVKSGGGASGTPVIASRSGRVEVVQRSNSGYGQMVLINHGDGYKTRYAHMIKGSITVSVGDYVEAGQTIGKVGSTGNSTGPHLHFEVIYNGETKNPANYIY